jgi:hypothetical protein
MRTFSPMKSEVDVTFGFNRSILETGTRVLVEMTPNVSPALTVQYCRLFAVVETCGDFGMLLVVVVVGDVDDLCSSPDRTSATAIVTASRNAAGAAYRRQSWRGRTPYQPDAAQISFFSRAASAPAA